MAKGNTFYFPIDLASIANKVLDTIRPQLFITIDTEIWPNVLHETRRRGIPIVMVERTHLRPVVPVLPLAPAFDGAGLPQLQPAC